MKTEEEVIDTSRKMEKSDIIPGLLVVCTWARFCGEEGHIDPKDIKPHSFYVIDANGKRIGDGWWGPEHWRIPLAIPVVKSEPIAAPIEPKVVAKKESSPCPSYYMGEDACNCGKHNTKHKFIFR